MRKNKLGYLSLLGSIGLLGLVTGNSGFYGFFGFFGFISMLHGKGSDERIDRNIERACRNAFAFDTVMAAFSIAYMASFKAVDVWSLALTFPFIGIVVFGLSYGYYDKKED